MKLLDVVMAVLGASMMKKMSDEIIKISRTSEVCICESRVT
jgi:hypothetical protein